MRAHSFYTIEGTVNMHVCMYVEGVRYYTTVIVHSEVL